MIVKSAVLAIAALALLSACTLFPTPQPSPPTPTAAPDLTTVYPVFGGDCAEVFSTSDISTAAGGGSVKLYNLATDFLTVANVTNLNGITCVWYPEGQSVISLSVLPAAVVSTTNDPPHCYGDDPGWVQGSCSFTHVSGGYFLSGIVQAPVGMLDDSAKRTTLALEATFDERAATWGEPVIRQLPAASWRTVSDCATLSTEAGLAQVTSIPDLTIQPGGSQNRPTYYGTFLWAGISAAANETGSSCYWYDPNNPTVSFSLHTVSGGAWMMDTLEFSAPIDVAGATRAEIVRTTYSTDLYATDGINCLVITTAVPEPWGADAAAALLTALTASTS